MFRHLLVPADDTEISAANVTAAVEFARGIGARITFFHANHDYSATGDGALMHAMSPSTFASEAAGPARAILAKAEAAARARGVACQGISTISDRPAQAILDIADQERCDLVFMASHGPTTFGGIMLGSETLKVLAGAKVPVLVSSVARNAEHRQRDTAIATIKDEHRSIAAVLHAMRSLAENAPDTDRLLDTALLRAAVEYLRAFPETLHHPKEERYIFSRLRARSPELAPVLDELELQHAVGATLLRDVSLALDDYDRRPDSAAARLREAVQGFSLAQGRHIETEETVVLPAAHEHFTDDDWIEIADAFGRNGDPRFDKDADLRDLFARLMNLAPSANRSSATQRE